MIKELTIRGDSCQGVVYGNLEDKSRYTSYSALSASLPVDFVVEFIWEVVR